MKPNSSQSPTPSTAQNLSAQLIFKQGRKEPLVGYLNERVVLAPIELKLEKGIYYNCKLRPMKGDKGYVVLSAEPAEPIRITLSFREGKEWKGMVGSYNSKIVIVPDGMEVSPDEFYACEIVLRPKGNAYHVQKAVALPPQDATVEANGYPVMMVQMRIAGSILNRFGFDCIIGDLKVLEKIIAELAETNIKNKQAVIAEYKSACIRIIEEHKQRTYAKNAKRF